MVWPCHKVFRLSKDNSDRQSSKEKIEKVHRRRGGNAILRGGQGWTLLAQLGQLKTGHRRKVICGPPTTSQGYGIDWTRLYLKV